MGVAYTCIEGLFLEVALAWMWQKWKLNSSLMQHLLGASTSHDVPRVKSDDVFFSDPWPPKDMNQRLLEWGLGLGYTLKNLTYICTSTFQGVLKKTLRDGELTPFRSRYVDLVLFSYEKKRNNTSPMPSLLSQRTVFPIKYVIPKSLKVSHWLSQPVRIRDYPPPTSLEEKDGHWGREGFHRFWWQQSTDGPSSMAFLSESAQNGNG